MDLTPDICERARQARDARFDGRFYIGVTSTGVFCRPTCPVQPPKADNVRYYDSAAAAHAAGFRPCLRCLPELAPGVRSAPHPEVQVEQALRRIEAGFLDEHTVDDLAAQAGISARHLARLFRNHVGATPHQVARTRRLLFAKQLLDDSNLSITNIAFAAGFGSLRRFNALVAETWGRPPRALRRQRSNGRSGDGLSLRLAFRAPLDWPGMLAFFAPRAIAGVESVDPEVGIYRRTVCLDGKPGWFQVRMAQHGNALALTARVADVRHLPRLVTRVRRMFDLDADPMAVTAALNGDRLLGKVDGVRIPGAWDPFEVAVRAILGQQISVAAAATLARRIVETHGESPDDPPAPDLDRLFPDAGILAEAPLEELGVIGTRARAIRHLAARVAAGDLDFHAPDLVQRLQALPGIGDWTAQYVCLRAGLDPDAFPAADLGLLRAAGNGRAMTPAALRRRAEAWRPWRGYAAICLWRHPAAGGRPRKSSPAARNSK